MVRPRHFLPWPPKINFSILERKHRWFWCNLVSYFSTPFTLCLVTLNRHVSTFDIFLIFFYYFFSSFSFSAFCFIGLFFSRFHFLSFFCLFLLSFFPLSFFIFLFFCVFSINLCALLFFLLVYNKKNIITKKKKRICIMF